MNECDAGGRIKNRAIGVVVSKRISCNIRKYGRGLLDVVLRAKRIVRKAHFGVSHSVLGKKVSFYRST